MAPGFKKKKICPKKTLGDILNNRRQRLKLTLEEAEKETNIRSKFLEAVEKNDWDKLPSEIYGRGFIERYSQFLKLDTEEILDRFDKERHLYQKMSFESKCFQGINSKPMTTMWLLTSRTLIFLIGSLILISIGGYVVWQIKHFSSAPELAIEYPKSQKKQYVNTDSVNLRGKTTPDSQLQINGSLVEVSKDGSFKQTIGLNKGENNILVTARNRSQKSRAEIVTIIANY